MCEHVTHLVVDKAVDKSRILQWLHLPDLPPAVAWPTFQVVNITWLQAAFATKSGQTLPSADEHRFQYVPVPPQSAAANPNAQPPSAPAAAPVGPMPCKRRSLVNFGNRWDKQRIKRKRAQWDRMEESPGDSDGGGGRHDSGDSWWK